MLKIDRNWVYVANFKKRGTPFHERVTLHKQEQQYEKCTFSANLGSLQKWKKRLYWILIPPLSRCGLITCGIQFAHLLFKLSHLCFKLSTELKYSCLWHWGRMAHRKVTGKIRDGPHHQNGWIFGKVPNDLWPPLIFGKSCCNFFPKFIG